MYRNVRRSGSAVLSAHQSTFFNAVKIVNCVQQINTVQHTQICIQKTQNLMKHTRMWAIHSTQNATHSSLIKTHLKQENFCNRKPKFKFEKMSKVHNFYTISY